jgi:hypothetical protein
VAGQGAPLASASQALSGQAVSLARGTVTAGTSDVTAALTGQALTAAQGSLTALSSYALSGATAAVSRGTIAPTFDATLASQSLIAEQGTAAPATLLTLLGSEIVATQGDVVAAAANDVTVELTGVAAFIAQTSVTPGAIAALVGSDMAAALGLIDGALHLQYPLAGVPQTRPRTGVETFPIAAQSRPLTAAQHRPNEGNPQHYPLEAA